MLQRVVDRLDEYPSGLPLTGLAVSQNGPFWRGAAALPTEEDWQLDSHAPLRDSAVANENWVPPAAGGLRCRRAGVSRCRGCCREGWKVHACWCVPSVVADRLWTVRGRQLDWRRSPFAG